jgi:hypothetical protein
VSAGKKRQALTNTKGILAMDNFTAEEWNADVSAVVQKWADLQRLKTFSKAGEKQMADLGKSFNQDYTAFKNKYKLDS